MTDCFVIELSTINIIVPKSGLFGEASDHWSLPPSVGGVRGRYACCRTEYFSVQTSE